jgi:outer membrane protein
LLLRIARAYFEVLAAEDAVSFVIAQKAAVSEQLAAAKRNFEVGTATITDQHEAQARYDLIIAQEITVRSDLEIKRTALQQIVGRKVGDLLPLRSNVALHPPQPAEMEKWVERAQDNSLVVRIQRAGVDVAAEEVKRSKGAQSPTLGFVGSLGFNDNDGSVQFAGGTQTKRASVGLQLAMPLYQGGALTARERESQKLVDKARFDVENARRSVAQAARQAYLSVASGLAQVKALEQALISNQSAVDSNKLGYQVGVRINIDVLNAEQQLFSTKRDLAQSRYGTILSMLQLKAAAGDLAEKDLLEVNALLGVDPPSPALTPSVAPAPATNPEPALVPPEPSKPADAAHKPAGRKAKPKPAAKPAG